jgi:predicted porin
VFAGTVGDWKNGVVLAAPQAGGAVGLGYDMDRLGVAYQWRAGWGGGKLDELLSEHEATVSYRVVRELRVVGTYLRMDPKRSETAENAVGIGASYTF